MGVAAIRDRQYDLSWSAGGGLDVGPVRLGSAKQGVEQYRGLAAVRVGAGMAAGGAMLMTWGLALLLPSISARLLGTGFNRRKAALTVVSLACLTTTVVSFWPPWRICLDLGPTGFWGTVVFYSVGVGLLRKTGEAVGPWLILGPVVVAIALGSFFPGLCVGFISAIFVLLFTGVHVVLLTSGREDHDGVRAEGRFL